MRRMDDQREESIPATENRGGGPKVGKDLGSFLGREARTVWLEPQNWEAGRA